VEVLPGVEGLIHVSEMSWTKRIQHPSDVLKVGERVEVAILKVDSAATRLSLGLRQVLGNPWDTVKDRYRTESHRRQGHQTCQVRGVRGSGGRHRRHDPRFRIHHEKRIEHPGELVKVGQTVRAVVLSADPAAKRLKLSLKQLEATSADQFVQSPRLATGYRRVLQVRGTK